MLSCGESLIVEEGWCWLLCRWLLILCLVREIVVVVVTYQSYCYYCYCCYCYYYFPSILITTIFHDYVTSTFLLAPSAA